MNAHINYDLPQSLIRMIPIADFDARRRVWATTTVLHEACRRGAANYAGRLYDLEAASADRIDDILRPGPARCFSASRCVASR